MNTQPVQIPFLFLKKGGSLPNQEKESKRLEAFDPPLRTEMNDLDIQAVCWKEFYSWMKRFLPRSIKEKREGKYGSWREKSLIQENSFPFPWAWSRSDSAWGAQAQEKEGNVHPSNEEERHKPRQLFFFHNLFRCAEAVSLSSVWTVHRTFPFSFLDFFQEIDEPSYFFSF